MTDERYDALVAAARKAFDMWDFTFDRKQQAEPMRALEGLLPKPLRRDDMVEQADAGRVPVRSILRDALTFTWESRGDVWVRAGEIARRTPSEIDAPCWPMQVVWLPEGADQ